MIPPTDSHPNPPAIFLQLLLVLGAINLFDIVEALAWLDSKEAQLVPSWWDDLCEIWTRCLGLLPGLILECLCRIQSQRTAPFLLPRNIRICQIHNIADPPTSNYIVM